MSLWKIAWRSIQQRGLASTLTAFSMALGVTLVVAVLVGLGVVTDSFRNQSSLGYSMIVGAKGGKLQLTLNTVYYLSEPIENVPFDFYLEFLPKEERAKYEGAEPRDGVYSLYTGLAVPLCLGDYYDRFRVVGTTPDMFDKLRFGDTGDRQYEFAEGRNFQSKSKEHGFFEAVLGATVAREKGLKVGQKISPSHGAPGGEIHEDEFTIVGVLRPTGTPNDRAVFVNMEGFFLMAGHAKPVEGGDPTADAAADRFKPLPLNQREVTSILVATTNPLVGASLQRTINKGSVAQAVLPVREIFTLFENIVGPIQQVLLALTIIICVVSGVSILVSIYNSMSDRRRDIAIMRAMGARRGQILWIVLLEAIILAVGGGLFGWLAGHALIAAGSRAIEARTGVQPQFWDLAPGSADWFGGSWPDSPLTGAPISPEALLIPGLIVLAILVGIWPAIAAYRTDVSKSLAP